MLTLAKNLHNSERLRGSTMSAQSKGMSSFKSSVPSSKPPRVSAFLFFLLIYPPLVPCFTDNFDMKGNGLNNTEIKHIPSSFPPHLILI